MIRRAIRLAMNGRGRVEPNPMVGCVIVKDDRVIGEGFHAEYGGPHAEPTALAACTESAAGATAYVTLEPCCHTTKQTPPCAPRLIEAKIARVVIGCLDPSPEVDGRGVAMLRASGIDVLGPLLDSSAKQLIAPFIAAVKHGRPYVTLKWAQSRDGKIAGNFGQPVRITNDASNTVVHGLRGRSDAIIVGTNTVNSDNPLLTARGVGLTRPLLRILLSNSLQISARARLVVSAKEQPLIIYCSEQSAREHQDAVSELREAGAEIVGLPDYEGRFSFSDALLDLRRRRVTHALVEPGPTLTKHLLARGLTDRVWIFRSPKPIGEGNALAAPVVRYPESARIDLAGDTLSEYLNPQSPVFFCADASADAVLLRASRA